jgi:hypothetical protein
MITSCCPFCGTESALSEGGCPDCRVSLDETPPPVLLSDDRVDEVVYELDDWPVSARVELTAALADRGVPSRWEPGLTLAVREIDDDVTESLLDELEESAAGGHGTPTGRELVVEAEGVVVDDAVFDDDDDDDGSVAQAAMADLFVAADRLMHEPDDEVVAAELGLAAGIVDDSATPYGIEPELWEKIRELAAVLCGDVDGKADEQVVADDARMLREVLRPYV